MAVTATPILLRANLSDSILQQYEITAARSGKTVEQVMSETLTRFADIDSAKPIILMDAERQSVERAIGKNISTGAELVRTVLRAVSVSVDGAEIALSQYLLDRLKSRCIGVDFEPFIRKTVVRLLEEYAGAR